MLMVRKLKIDPKGEIDAFAYKSGSKQWRVVEASTGLMMAEGETKTKAIEQAKERVDEVGIDKIKELTDKALKRVKKQKMI